MYLGPKAATSRVYSDARLASMCGSGELSGAVGAGSGGATGVAGDPDVEAALAVAPGEDPLAQAAVLARAVARGRATQNFNHQGREETHGKCLRFLVVVLNVFMLLLDSFGPTG